VRITSVTPAIADIRRSSLSDERARQARVFADNAIQRLSSSPRQSRASAYGYRIRDHQIGQTASRTADPPKTPAISGTSELIQHAATIDTARIVWLIARRRPGQTPTAALLFPQIPKPARQSLADHAGFQHVGFMTRGYLQQHDVPSSADATPDTSDHAKTCRGAR
jgi:hypothetical protein